MTSERGITTDMDPLNLSIFSDNSFKNYFKDINNINKIDSEGEIPAINCKYVDLNSFDYKNKKGCISLFHLNIASLSKNKDELETILNMIDLKFDVIGITETKIKSANPPRRCTLMH